jgi:hypothetical protein
MMSPVDAATMVSYVCFADNFHLACTVSSHRLPKIPLSVVERQCEIIK